MKLLCVSVAALMASTAAYAADLPTKKGEPVAPPPPNCFSSLYAYFNSTPADCPLSYWGLTFYATIDIGGGYETHGVPFNSQMHTGVEELLQKNSNKPLWLLTPNGLSQSQVGIKAKEPLAYGWSFVGEVATGFDPYSLQLSNGPGAQAQNNLTLLPNQSANADSSRAGQYYNSVGYAGFSNDVYGTLTAGRQNALSLDGINAYDPMGGSYAFSLIGWSGKTAGGGQTETARINTSVKYAVNLPYNLRTAAIVQFGGYDYYNGSNGQWEVDVGGDFFDKNLSVDAIYGQTKDQVSLSGYDNLPGLSGGPPKGAPTNALKATLDNDQTFILLAKYKWNQFTVYGGWEHDYFTNPSDTSFPNGFTSIGGEPVLASGITTTNYTKPLNFDVLWTGGKYSVLPNLDLVGAYYLYIQQDFNSTGTEAANCAPNTAAAYPGSTFAPLGTKSSKCKGYEDAWSFMVDYRPLKRVDLYAGVFYSKVSGGLATGYLESDNIAPTAGIRVRF
jgi:predicted porin